jgi:hypothetical protein
MRGSVRATGVANTVCWPRAAGTALCSDDASMWHTVARQLRFTMPSTRPVGCFAAGAAAAAAAARRASSRAAAPSAPSPSPSSSESAASSFLSVAARV